MTETPKAVRQRGVVALLAESAFRNAKPNPKGKPKRLLDGGGLSLVVEPTGRRWWRMRYTYARAENTLSLGDYPDTPTKAAREAASLIRWQVSEGINPSAMRKQAEAAIRLEATKGMTFTKAFEHWHEVKCRSWTAAYAAHTLAMMERDVLPVIGKRPACEVQPLEVTDMIRKVEARGAVASAHRLRSFVSQVYRLHIAEGRLTLDPAEHTGEAMVAVPKGKHHPAITEPVRFGELLRAIDSYGGFATRQALKMHALTFQRSSEVYGMRWSEVDTKAALWTIPSARMKRKRNDKDNGEPHLVPLSRQALSIIEEMRPLRTAAGLVFPGESPRHPVSRLTTWAAIKALGFKDHTPHGFRASARTMLDEVLGFQEKVIDAQEAHAVKDSNGRAYNRTSFMPQRTAMMQAWADYLDNLRAGVAVSELKDLEA